MITGAAISTSPCLALHTRSTRRSSSVFFYRRRCRAFQSLTRRCHCSPAPAPMHPLAPPPHSLPAQTSTPTAALAPTAPSQLPPHFRMLLTLPFCSITPKSSTPSPQARRSKRTRQEYRLLARRTRPQHMAMSSPSPRSCSRGQRAPAIYTHRLRRTTHSSPLAGRMPCSIGTRRRPESPCSLHSLHRQIRPLPETYHRGSLRRNVTLIASSTGLGEDA